MTEGGWQLQAETEEARRLGWDGGWGAAGTAPDWDGEAQRLQARTEGGRRIGSHTGWAKSGHCVGNYGHWVGLYKYS